VAIGLCAFFLLAPSAFARELKKETLERWDEYIQASTSDMQARLRPGGHFLWVDEVPERAQQVRNGEILVAPVGRHVPKTVPSGLIHHWIGAAFIPDVKLEDVLGALRDYDRYKTFYKPTVIESKSLVTDGPSDKFSILLMSKEGSATLVLQSDYEACYVQQSPKQWYSVARTTRAQEVRDYGHDSEHKLPPDEGSGYIWRIHNVARFEERDGGVYVEEEGILLSRDIPVALRWFVDPIVRRLSRNALLVSLRQTEEAVRSKTSLASLPSTTATSCVDSTQCCPAK
jgi:hypothetical protein